MPRASDIEVDIPGVGLVYFPPEMSMDAIRAKSGELSKIGLQHQHNRNLEAEAQAQPVEFMGLRPAEIAEGVRAVGMFGGPIGAAIGEAEAQGIELAGGARDEINPLSIGAQAAIPEGVRQLGRAARPLAKSLYGSALKLSSKIKPDKAERILETGLNEGRIATTRSIKKSLNKQKEIEAEIDAKIATNPNAPIDSEKVAARVDQVRPRFETATPEADRAILSGAQEEFVRNYPPPNVAGPTRLTAERAQLVKKATYKKLGDASYGELKGAEKESQKALARGLKEELEVLWPELKELNAREGALFDLNRALAQAARRIGNRDVMGIGIPIKMEAFGKVGFLAGILDTPGVKQRLAIAIDKARHLEKVKLSTTSKLTRAATLPSMYEE